MHSDGRSQAVANRPGAAIPFFFETVAVQSPAGLENFTLRVLDGIYKTQVNKSHQRQTRFLLLQKAQSRAGGMQRIIPSNCN